MRGGAAAVRRRRSPVRRRSRRFGGTTGARRSLRHFRQASLLAVAITAFLLVFFPAPEGAAAPQAGPVAQVPDTVSVIEDIPVEDLQAAAEDSSVPASVRADTLLAAARQEAATTLRDLWYGFLSNLPKVLVALVVLVLAAAAVRLVRPVLRRALGQWERSSAAIAVVGIGIWMLALGIAVSVLAGDIRALVGSLGLVGLALSWALQTPIESFTGWLLNSFQGYYRVGDRVAVGEVFGDVYRIDFLTTTVWEIGSLERPGFVQAEQPTGRLITFPNNEVLSGSIVNLTRDFPYVWDELTVAVGNRSDLGYATALLAKLAAETLEGHMQGPAEQYGAILRGAGIPADVSGEPQVFVSLEESWTSLTVRYLVGARERRTWKSRLATVVAAEFNRPDHADRIVAAYPRQQVQLVGADDRPKAATWMQ